MIRTLAIGILSTFILACEKLPDPVVPDTPRAVYIDGIWNQEDPDKWLTIIQVPVEKA